MPAVALHSPDDRFAHAPAICGDCGWVEAGTTVAHEDVDTLGACLRVHVNHRPAAELRRVHHGLTGRRHERLSPLAQRALAHPHAPPARPVVTLAPPRCRFECGAERDGAAGRRPPAEPRTQLTLLAT